MAQTPPDESAELVLLRDRLRRPDELQNRAWGVFRAGRFHDVSLQALLIDELRNKRELRSARKDSAEFAYVQLLFDALIAGGASVPSDVVWPYIRGRIPECLILLARSGVAEGKLLSLLDSDLDDSEWLLVNELLLGMHSGRFLAHMVEGAQPEHIFGIWDPHDGWELQDINIGDARTPPPGQTRTVPAGFPPVGVYELFAVTPSVGSWPGTGDVLVMAARYPIYYRRIVLPTGGSVQWGGRFKDPADRQWYCLELLAEASGMDAQGLFRDITLVPWTGPGALTGKTAGPLQAQEAGIRRLVESARQAGFQNIPSLHIRIQSKIEDRRRKSHDPVPAPDDHSFSID
jgi:hypothetical protein